MGSVVQLKNVDENIVPRTILFEEVDALPFMQSPIPLLTLVAAYFLFVFKIGPAFMKNRKPYSLKNTLIVYNIIQVALSLYLFVRYVKFINYAGVVYSKCHLTEYNDRQQGLWNIWWYAAAKATELLDTVFFILRKKYNQASFLHVYHHSLMLTGTWFYLKYAPSDIVTFSGAFNSFVHIIMYSYYALAAMGPHMNKYLTWKKHLTTLQLIQFVTCFFVYIGNLMYSQCPPSKFVATFIVTNNFIFMYLFSRFYYQNYIKNNKKGTKNELSKSE